MAKTKKKRSLIRKILITIPIVILVIGIILFLLMHFGINSSFGRGGYPDYPTTHYRYEHYQEKYPRLEKTFQSGKNQLKAYVYGDLDADRLLVFSHGLGAGHEHYIDEIIHMVEEGYLVFAHDATGSATSEGKSTVGLVQSAIDLEAALEYIDSDEDLKDLPKYLMGHSWGGFAVAEALGYRKDIVAVASIAGYAYPVELLAEEGSRMAEMDISGGKFLLDLNLFLNFGAKNYKRNAVDSINASQTPILLVHGRQDQLISFDHTSIVAHKDELTNPNVETFIMSQEGQSGHDNIFHPTEELAYIAEKNQAFKKLMEEYNHELPLYVRQKYIDSVDLDRVNKINSELFEKITNFFDEAS